MALDIEVKAMRGCIRAVKELDTAARNRVMRYVLDLPDSSFGDNPMAAQPSPTQAVETK